MEEACAVFVRSYIVTPGDLSDNNGIVSVSLGEISNTWTHSPMMLFSFASYLFKAVTLCDHGIVRDAALHVLLC